MTIDYRARPHQLAALTSEKPITFLGAGVGAGKTDCGALWMLHRVLETPLGTLGLVCANTYSQLMDATLRSVFGKLDEWGIPHRPLELPRSHSPINLEVWNGEHLVTVLCRSLDSYENLSGIEVGWAWLDEVWQTKPEAFYLVQARCRDKAVKNRMLLTTTLDDPASWMYEVFVEKHDPERQRVIYAGTEANQVNLPEGYIDGLRATYSERMFDRMVKAKWVSLEGGRIYYAFDRQLHISDEVEFDPALPICWSLDFNIGEGKPMSSVVGQIRKGKSPEGEVRTEAHVLDEIILDTADTNDAVDEFTGRWGGKGEVIVFGDATGRARDTRSKTSDYEIIADAGFVRHRVPKANPPIRERHNICNAMLKSASGDVRVKIHPGCRTLAKGLETVKLKGGANYIEDDSQREQHVTAAWGYWLAQDFPLKARVFSGGRMVRLA